MKKVIISLTFVLFACQQKANDDPTLLAEAKTEIDKGHYETAIILLDTLIARNATNDSAIYFRGIAYSKHNDTENAINDFSLLIKISETFGNKALNKRGILYYQNNEHEKAMQDFDEAIKNDPGDFHNYYSRGILKTEMKLFGKNPEESLSIYYTEKGNEFYYDFKGALEDFNEAIKLDSTFVDCYVKRGILYINLHQNDKALDDFNKAIIVDSLFADAYLKRAILYEQTGNLKGAIKDINTAIELEPENPFAYAIRGHFKEIFQNDKAGAEKDYQKAEELDIKKPGSNRRTVTKYIPKNPN